MTSQEKGRLYHIIDNLSHAQAQHALSATLEGTSIEYAIEVAQRYPERLPLLDLLTLQWDPNELCYVCKPANPRGDIEHLLRTIQAAINVISIE